MTEVLSRGLDEPRGRVEIIPASDLDWQLPGGWERFRNHFGMGRYRWFSIHCGDSPHGYGWKFRNKKRLVPWDHIVTIDCRPVGALGVFHDYHFGEVCYQINWALRIPPTRLGCWAKDDAKTFAYLFAERHKTRLLRAIESPSAAAHMDNDRVHVKPYELGIALSFYWPENDESRTAWVLDRRGDKVEALFDGTTEPVVIRKSDEHEFSVWDRLDGYEARFGTANEIRANARRSMKAQRRPRNPDGTFTRVADETTTKPDAPHGSTGLHVGAQ